MNKTELTCYLNESVERLIKSVLKETVDNPKETKFLISQTISQKHQANLRNEQEKAERHIPTFLIASITQRCNLHCSGCYSRGRNMCSDKPISKSLTSDEWADIFAQAENLGISFCILAGGEPLLRKDVLEKAAEIKKIVFPVFTNGTLFNDETTDIFDRYRNLIPILSIEGDSTETNKRRGEGVAEKIENTIQNLNSKGILFGVSITLTKDNYFKILSTNFLNYLEQTGARIVFLIAYSATAKDTKQLELSDIHRADIQNRLECARKKYRKLWFLSFPGDEEYMGGCLAGGRGFFHISPTGAAEPCPFSPYSDRNLRNVSLKEALESPLFQKLSLAGLVGGEHDGGCALIEHEEEVKKLL